MARRGIDLSGRPGRYKPKIDPRVKDARRKRGRPLDMKSDRCSNCLHFVPPQYCPLRGYTTASGVCALHEAAA